MKYQVLDSIKLKTSKGEMDLQPGHVIRLHADKATQLIDGKKIQALTEIMGQNYESLCEWLKIISCHGRRYKRS
jgi:hypothetical protein